MAHAHRSPCPDARRGMVIGMPLTPEPREALSATLAEAATQHDLSQVFRSARRGFLKVR